MPTEIARISAELRRMYDGPAWHGPGVQESLAGLTAEQAATRVVPHAHSIYEITHHIAAWIGEVRARLLGKVPGNPDDGDWPPASMRVTAEEWQRTRDRLASRQADLLTTLASFDEARLDQRLDPKREGPAGQVTFYILVHGLVQHNAYHAGQLMLLRRALGA